MFFQNFEPFQTYELPLLLRNNDKVNVCTVLFLNILSTTYLNLFKIISLIVFFCFSNVNKGSLRISSAWNAYLLC